MENTKVNCNSNGKGHLTKHKDNKPMVVDGIKVNQRVIGSLLYLANGMKYDIAFVCQYFAKYMGHPCILHLQGVKCIFQYLQRIKNLVLQYGKMNASLKLVSYTDADWRRGQVIHCSLGGFAFAIEGALITWYSKKQPTILLSSIEAEYAASTIAAKKAL